MKRYKVMGVVLLLGLATCASLLAQQAAMAPPQAPIPPASSPEALAAGARLAQQYCTRCHAEGITDGPASQLDLTNQAWTGHAWHHPDSVLVQMIADGVSRTAGVMPPFGSVLRSDEIRTLIAFIKTFWTPDQRQFQQERTRRADLQGARY
jgi:S-disulfanyl-L-cysteine oxidoreductase SoxD